MKLNLISAFFCLAGWVAHWLLSWSVQFKIDKKRFFDYVDDDPPAFLFSIVATIVVYFTGPSIIALTGYTLPAAFSDPGVVGVLAFLIGYNADSLLRKLVQLSPFGAK
jgi:hypothetical protein